MGACRRCARERDWMCRGLCNSCYKDRGIRQEYGTPPSSGRTAWPDADHCGDWGAPTTPCLGLPGSEMKVQALQERAALGISLWHPQDLRLSDLPASYWLDQGRMPPEPDEEEEE